MSSERTLTLIQGSVRPFDIILFDGNDELENLTGATNATFRVLADPEDVTDLELDVDTEVDAGPPIAGEEVAIDITNSKLTVTMTQAQADALEPGLFVGQAGIKISGSWLFTEPFHVRVRDSFAPTV